MRKAPVPKYEKKRLAALKKLAILDTKPDARFDRITKKATEIFNVPISTISLIDENREWFKSCQGLDNSQDERAISFCAHAMLANEIFIVEDTLLDPRFSDNPHVTNEGIRFYAGIALHENTSHMPIGVFCIKDFKPRKFSAEELHSFLELGKDAEQELNR